MFVSLRSCQASLLAYQGLCHGVLEMFPTTSCCERTGILQLQHLAQRQATLATVYDTRSDHDTKLTSSVTTFTLGVCGELRQVYLLWATRPIPTSGTTCASFGYGAGVFVRKVKNGGWLNILARHNLSIAY